MQNNKPFGLSRVNKIFCIGCGSVFPEEVGINQKMTCGICQVVTHHSWFKNMTETFDIGYGKKEVKVQFKHEYLSDPYYTNFIQNNWGTITECYEILDEIHAGGAISSLPIMKRICSHCNHNEMSYRAIQNRSADEGESVIYTCLKCCKTEYEQS